jgi:hypothetical protein
VAQLRRLQARADNRFAPVAQLAGGPEEEELIQGKFASPEHPAQLQQAPRANNTGLPDQLKSGIESLSGLSMDHVRVHYNSAQPAQLNALAYAQGSDIHLAPGQEQHLPHEAWHVVQQAQGRVRPTMQMKDGMQVNDDVGLEREADVMGEQATIAANMSDPSGSIQRRAESAKVHHQPEPDSSQGEKGPLHCLSSELHFSALQRTADVFAANSKGTINRYGGVLSPNIPSTSAPAQLQAVVGDLKTLAGEQGDVHWHYTYDPNDIYSLHLTLADRRPEPRTWVSRQSYEPTGTDSGDWTDWVNNHGITPGWATALAKDKGRDPAAKAFHKDPAVKSALEKEFSTPLNFKDDFPPLPSSAKIK